MKLSNTSRAMVAGMAIFAALTMSACNSDDNAGGSKSTTSAAATSSTADAATPPIPSAEELNSELQRALDPNVPLQEKVDMVQGADADPDLINRVAEAAKQAGASVVVTKVNDLGGSLSADANFTINGQTNPAVVPFVAENGKWKLEKGWACQMVSIAQLTSKACA